jgi:hypothetical protein
LEQIGCFQQVEAGFTRKLVVLRNLEAKFMKTGDLCGPIHEIDPGATPRVYAENKASEDIRHGCAGDLGGVEEPGAVFVFGGSQEHAVGGAGDEVADVLETQERGHGQAVGSAGTALGRVDVSGLLQGGRVNL